MKKISLFLIMVLLVIGVSTSICAAADVKLDWDVTPGATGYLIAMSIDMGKTWLTPIDAKLVKPYLYSGVPDDKFLIFKVAAYNGAATIWNDYAGAWFDQRLKMLPPAGIGIK